MGLTESYVDAAKDCIEEFLCYGSQAADAMRDEKAKTIAKHHDLPVMQCIDGIEDAIAENI